MLEQEPAPFASRAEFLHTLIAEFFGREEQKALQKQAILEFIRSDPDIVAAIRERALAILSEELSATRDE